MMEPVADECYKRRRQVVADWSNKYRVAKVADGSLYQYKNHSLLEDILDDMDALLTISRTSKADCNEWG